MEKIEKLRALMEKKNLDAFIVTSAQNRRYISGFTGSAGLLIITKSKQLFITDFRYIEQATEQAPDFEIIEHKQSIIQEAAAQLLKEGAQQAGFEHEDVTFALYQQFQNAVHADLIPSSGLIEELRLIKSEAELAIMKTAAEIADAAYTHILTFVKPGMKEIEVSNELEFFMRKQGATQSSFDTIVASGYRSALPHGVASDKEIQKGELVTLDYGALYNGYCSDITRTFAVGEISDKLREIYDIVLEANLRGVAGVKPGITGKEADALTRDYISEKGYGQYFGHSTGHGLGMDVHESPALSFRSDTVLKPGMVVTVEPGIYIPEVGGCRIEDDLVLTADGSERLTFSTKDLITL
ncbi:M24 family metallopeptidase [Terribacillus saccharophilus]|uniref:Xaa-Pro aminopeptidase n=1 Tax=Terribacillus saccharophilus TaxID=361277 RepID=A0A075LLF7_9BACI|nr:MULTISPECIES: Xaa-Pro peptidase family protein [Terribacillus]AIF66772.1 Xaa-Pro dipeptidase [Terribacillus goriensis]MCM3224518.1 Xaa-Pro peptidase family protein [Terribacillus saccharophilus]MEC0283586.1 Xaa-Pro peptidase family protein [Terribacillus saccharophilus]MEC0290542.1 Xaa-Pro peptidase family protein [Terribacillus saccharophilus]MEC0303953.1 Xaa-Pro peptidase family protein [Terribacillus saccharophilus]